MNTQSTAQKLVPTTLNSDRTGILQRQCTSCGQHTVAGGTCDECQKVRSPLQRFAQRSAVPQPQGLNMPEPVYATLNSAGHPLDSRVRNLMEPRFGHDFSQVQVHTDARAAASARAVQAVAYTVGRHIVFGVGQYAPNTTAGQRLLAHELTHVVQQRGQDGLQPSLEMGPVDDRYEREADQIANAVVERSPLPLSSPLPQPSRLQTKRLQRQTDASVETGTGVGPAIAAGTMTTVPAVHGTTFTARDCFGRNGCNIHFNFAKAYKGDYNYVGGGGAAVRGVYVKISMTYDHHACGNCNQLLGLQILRNITRSGGNFVTADPVDPVRRERSGWSNPNAPSRGWRVDREITATNPFYTSSWVGQAGSSTSPAIIWDTPGDWTTSRNVGKEFRTCAICSNSTTRRTTLGCVDWGYYTDSSGSISFRPATPTASCGANQMLRDAVQRWEGISGNQPVNLGEHRPTSEMGDFPMPTGDTRMA